MTKLTHKKVKFYGGDKEEAFFQLLKQKLCSAPILALLVGAENFIVYYDASHKGLGVVLMQNEKVIAYASRQLKIHVKNLMRSLLDFYTKFYNSLSRAPNRCSSSIVKTQRVVIVHSRNRLGRLDHGLT
ncbi:putative reverse transcriptase domain-containing protein [Tanacetum coccineum]